MGLAGGASLNDPGVSRRTGPASTQSWSRADPRERLGRELDRYGMNASAYL